MHPPAAARSTHPRLCILLRHCSCFALGCDYLIYWECVRAAVLLTSMTTPPRYSFLFGGTRSDTGCKNGPQNIAPLACASGRRLQKMRACYRPEGAPTSPREPASAPDALTLSWIQVQEKKRLRWTFHGTVDSGLDVRERIAGARSLPNPEPTAVEHQEFRRSQQSSLIMPSTCSHGVQHAPIVRCDGDQEDRTLLWAQEGRYGKLEEQEPVSRGSQG